MAGTEATAASPLIIRPPGRWGVLSMREVWAYRELLYFLMKRDILIRYKQSLLGVSWAVFQPLALALIFWVFFGRLANIPHEGVPYPVFALGALVAWNFVSQAITQGSTSLVGDANLLAKVYFPRLIVPVAKVLSLTLDLAVALLVLAVFMAAYGVVPGAEALTLPLWLLLGLLVAVGAALVFSALNVRYRDTGLVVPLLAQMGLFLTPVVYPASLVPERWEWLYSLNPMVAVVSGTRWALFGTPAPSAVTILGAVGVTLGLLLFALAYFRRVERFFADVV